MYGLNWTDSCGTDVNVFTSAEADLAALKELLMMVLALKDFRLRDGQIWSDTSNRRRFS